MGKGQDRNLPRSARSKLSDTIHAALIPDVNLRGPHSLPVSHSIWNHYVEALSAAVAQFSRSVSHIPENQVDFKALKAWIEDVVQHRAMIISLLLALRPFERFPRAAADELRDAVDGLLMNLASKLEGGVLTESFQGLDNLPADRWNTAGNLEAKEVLSRAFGLELVDLRDGTGEFSAARVFSAYYLRNSLLIRQIEPHLYSLGLPVIADPLVAVSILGWLLSADDAVEAYCAMEELLSKLLRAEGKEFLIHALDHLDKVEPRLRQSRQRVNRVLQRQNFADLTESDALNLAEAYKRLVEGPVRQYGWLHHELKIEKWSMPPMVTVLREGLVADGGWLGGRAEKTILTDIRNGEAHESLEWDGFDEVFVTEGNTVAPSVVVEATKLADAFARGSQAAIAGYRALSIVPTTGGPRLEDPGRLSGWRRAEAHFGTNGLQVVRKDFNARNAKIWLTGLWTDNINPCFQALVCSQGLLPGVERFEIHVESESTPRLVVSADALAQTYGLWEQAVEHLSVIPLSTFLPANFDTRSNFEEVSQAVRAVAWIAVDDFLDAVDGCPAKIDGERLALLIRRICLVGMATELCLERVPATSQIRLSAVNLAATEFLQYLESLKTPVHLKALMVSDPVVRAREWFDRWGPVSRLPGIVANPVPSARREPEVRLRSAQDSRELRWRTI